MDKKRARQLRLKADRLFIDGKDSYVKAFDALKRDAVSEFPCLHAIIDVANDGRVVSEESTLEASGLSGWKVVRWSIEDENYGRPTSTADGGCAVFAVSDAGERKAIISLKELAQSTDIEEVRKGVHLAILLHELGHVDDFAKGLHLIPGKEKLDVCAAELYAHKFACDRMFTCNFKLALMHYLEQGVEKHLESGSAPVREAAKLFLATPEYRRYKRATACIMDSKNKELFKARYRKELEIADQVVK